MPKKTSFWNTVSWQPFIRLDSHTGGPTGSHTTDMLSLQLPHSIQQDNGLPLVAALCVVFGYLSSTCVTSIIVSENC